MSVVRKQRKEKLLARLETTTVCCSEVCATRLFHTWPSRSGDPDRLAACRWRHDKCRLRLPLRPRPSHVFRPAASRRSIARSRPHTTRTGGKAATRAPFGALCAGIVPVGSAPMWAPEITTDGPPRQVVKRARHERPHLGEPPLKSPLER